MRFFILSLFSFQVLAAHGGGHPSEGQHDHNEMHHDQMHQNDNFRHDNYNRNPQLNVNVNPGYGGGNAYYPYQNSQAIQNYEEWQGIQD